MNSFFTPLAEMTIHTIGSQPSPMAAEYAKRYREQVQQVVAAIQNQYRGRDHQRIAAIKQALLQVKPDFATTDTLTQTVIRGLRSTEGVDYILVGMSKEAYVLDVLSEVKKPIESPTTEEEWRLLQEKMVQVVMQ